jgi:hypothetical protein
VRIAQWRANEVSMCIVRATCTPQRNIRCPTISPSGSAAGHGSFRARVDHLEHPDMKT